MANRNCCIKTKFHLNHSNSTAKQSSKSETKMRTRDHHLRQRPNLKKSKSNLLQDLMKPTNPINLIESRRTFCQPITAAPIRTTDATNPIRRPIMILLNLIVSSLLVNQLSAGAVVRPTIFSGLSGPDEAAQIIGGQQQQLPQPQVTPSISQSPISDGPQAPSTKISPFKSRFCTALNGAKLDAPLGLQSLAIDDLALSASSYSNEQVGPHLARLNLDISGGAWCPVKPISNSNFGKEWIQAKLNRSFVVTAIETQGRFGMGNGKEFVPSYQIEYSRNGGHTWHKWKDFRGSSLLRANEDVNSPVKNELSPPIVGANVIRILPYSQHLKTVCLRFELHGCLYDEGAPMAYTTSDGVVEPRWGHLIDYTYDGHRSRGLLSQGLGQLVDGVKGPDNFSHNAGFEWVGWKSMNGDVVIEFSFKTVRNFTGALFHSNNLFSSGVEVFQSVDVHYGIDVPLSMEALKDSLLEQRRRDALYRRPFEQGNGGSNEELHQLAHLTLQQQQHQTLWSNDILSIEYEPDKKLESSRPVTVHLKQRLANKLRFVLKFASKWILVSEVEFLSHPVELLSLASVDQQTTPALLGALTPAKTYDEFVAILREHQLRRIATNAYLQSFAGVSSTPAGFLNSTETSPEPSGDQPSADPSPYDEIISGNRRNGPRVTGPAIPSTVPMWSTSQQPTGPQPATDSDLPASPSTNPILNNVMGPFGPMQPTKNTFQSLDLSPPADPFSPQTNNDSISSPSINEKRTLGLATVISFVVVSILLFVGVLFAISSYRLRHQPKLGIPHLPHHLSSTAAVAGASQSKTMSPPSLQSFMSVFSSSNNNQQQQHHYQDNHFNAIFATGNRQPRDRTTNGSAAAQTLRRLATIGQQQQQPKGGHPLLGGQPNNQLLVSVKDSTNGKGPVSTQLILGLNQANPLAQQQVYSSCNGGQPTYSTSMSMASSSTTGHQGDYGEYAIPDAQPIIPPINSMTTNGGHQLAFATHQHHLHHHHQQHLNPAFSASPAQGTFKQPFSCQTDLRSNHRNHQQTNLIQPQVIHQHQQQQQQQRMSLDHKYELIQQQEPQRTPQQAHNRTLSGQLQAVGSCVGQQQQPTSFNSMTLSHGRHLHDSGAANRPMDECSPGGGSNASGATTATTSANSSSAGVGDLARYYYVNDD